MNDDDDVCGVFLGDHECGLPVGHDGAHSCAGDETVRLRAELATAQAAPEREFLAASIAVWREIDRLSAEPGGYQGLGAWTELRRRERAAWETYRDWLASVSLPADREEP